MANNGVPFGRPLAAEADPQQDFNYIISRILGKRRTITIVQVVAVKESSGAGDHNVGLVDVRPLVQEQDSAGGLYSHGILHNVPFFRLQGGGNAVVINPEVGDIGIAAICDRDITNVKATKAEAAPGSDRRCSLDQALYIGGLLNGTPSQFIRFSKNGIEITSPKAVTVNAPRLTYNGHQVSITAPGGTQITGPVNVAGEVTANGIPLSTHKHKDTQPGNGNTGAPTS